MLVYLLIWVLLFLLSTNRRNTKIIYVAVSLLVIVLGLRDMSVGTDTVNYYQIFEDIKVDGRSYVEPLWFLMNKMILFFGRNYTSLMLLVATLTLYPLAIVLKRDSVNPMLSLFFYYSLCFYGMAFNISSQILAVSFVLMGYSYLNRKKIWIFSAFVIIASLIHLSSIIAFSILIFDKIKLTSTRIYLFLASSLLFGTFIVNDRVISLVAGKYASYLLSSEEGYRSSLLIPFILTLILNLLFVFLYIQSKRKIKLSLWFKLYLLSVMINNATFILVLGSRLMIYFSIAQIIYFVSFIYNNKMNDKIAAAVILCLYSATLFLRMILTNGGEIVPYEMSFDLF